MTWLTTWPENGIPRYAEHPSEDAAIQHQRETNRDGTPATVVWMGPGEAEAGLGATRRADGHTDATDVLTGAQNDNAVIRRGK